MATSPAVSLLYEEAKKLLPDLPEGEADRSRAYTRYHLLWTEQQVLDRYGKPNAAGDWGNGDNRVRWSYSDEHDKRQGFTFVLYQGRVEKVLAQ